MHTARLLTVPQHALCRGCLPGGYVCLPGGVCLPGVCLPSRVSAQGGSAWGDVCLGGCLPRGCIPACNGADPPWTDRHLWKHNLRNLRLRTVKIVYNAESYLAIQEQKNNTLAFVKLKNYIFQGSIANFSILWTAKITGCFFHWPFQSRFLSASSKGQSHIVR